MTDPYRQFLERKVRLASNDGFDVELADLHPWLKPHAAAITRWGVQGGRRAYFTAFGLHKTSMQLETCRQIMKRAGGEGLIVCPLGVRQEFFGDAGKLDMEVHFIRSASEIREGGLHLTNYETVRDGKLDPALFKVASLDEADVLRSYGSKTFQELTPAFEAVPYRFVACATPSPNRYKELIHYAGFLGVMDTGQALTRFFQRDSQKAGNLTLYPHKEREFWLWVNSWAIFLQKPSDLGFSDDGYILPELDVRWHEVKVDLGDVEPDKFGRQALFRSTANGVQDAAREKRLSMPARIAKAAELRAARPDDHVILWHDLEDERRALEQAIPAVRAVYGTQELDEREKIVLGFKEGTVTDLAAKPVMLGAGGNLQAHCAWEIFCGVGHKFRDFIQAIHRVQRFGQTRPVTIDIIYAETERPVRQNLEAKWRRHEELCARMSEIIREFGLNPLAANDALQRSIGVERVEAKGEGWLAANNDCVAETRTMEADSTDLIVTSIPFSNHYEYTPSYNDFGHTEDDGHFFEQMDYLSPELLRILKPGRIAAVHVKDRILFGSVTGMGTPTVNPFHAKCIAHYQAHGFAYMGLIFVSTDVVRENNQTYRLGWSENCKDGTKMGVGSPEFVLIFRKLPTDRSKAYADEPVKKDKADYTRARWQTDAHALWRSSGNRLLTAEEMAQLGPDQLAKLFTAHSLANVYDYEAHVRIGEALEARGALPATFMALQPGSHRDDCWFDIARMRTLNGEQTARGLENHICPLQFDIVDRLIERYSNPGDLVFDPFGGLMTVPLRALKLGRRGRGVELNPGYFLDGVAYLAAEERSRSMPSLFDLSEQSEAA